MSRQAHVKLVTPELEVHPSVRRAAENMSWAAFVDEWRQSYYGFCSSCSSKTIEQLEEESGFPTVTQHMLTSLETLLVKHNVRALFNDHDVPIMARSWRMLVPWPDAVTGMLKLHDECGMEIASLSNADESMMKELAINTGLPLQHLFTAESLGAYKPNPAAYLGAVETLGLKAEEVALVAAHLADLEAANKCGLKTIYVERGGEEQWEAKKVQKAKDEGWVDIWVSSEDGGERGGFLELWRRMAAITPGVAAKAA